MNIIFSLGLVFGVGGEGSGYKCVCNYHASGIIWKFQVLLQAAVTVGESAKAVCASFPLNFFSFHIQEQSQYGSFMMLHIKS